MKKLFAFTACLALCFALVGCDPGKVLFVNPGDALGGGGTVSEPPSATTDSEAGNSAKNEAGEIEAATEIPADATAVTESGKITQAGNYLVSGEIDGKINVKAEGVHLFLSGAHVSADEKAIASDYDLTITLVGENTVENRANDAGDVKNAVDASGNLTVNGTGSLLVNSVKNGIAGNSIAIKDATVSVTAEKDGLHAEIGAYDDLTEAPVFSYGDGGYVHLDGAKLTVVSADDGIQADTFVLITGQSEVNATANGGAPATITESSSDSASGKGIKAGSLDWGADGNELSGVDYLVLIESGTIAVDSNDDGIHSDGIVEINGGTITLSTGDDGVHAESLLAVNGGSVTVSRSYEGLEGAKVEIADGRIDVTATDDGINAADGTSGGFGFSAANANCHLIVSGGEVRVNAQGDGLDSNGTMLIEGGVVLVSGPTNGGNAALDSDGGILVNGGYLFAAGPLGMVETPATNSEQNVLSYAHQSSLAADTLLSLTDGEGNTLFSFLSPKTCQSVILSCPELETGGTYSIYGGDTLLCTFTVSSRITTVGSSGSIGNPSGRPGKR